MFTSWLSYLSAIFVNIFIDATVTKNIVNLINFHHLTRGYTDLFNNIMSISILMFVFALCTSINKEKNSLVDGNIGNYESTTGAAALAQTTQ